MFYLACHLSGVCLIQRVVIFNVEMGVGGVFGRGVYIDEGDEGGMKECFQGHFVVSVRVMTQSYRASALYT